MTIAWTGGWPIAIAVALAAAACSRARVLQPDRADRIAIAGVFVLALALRLGLGVWAPLHINGQGPLWIGAAAGRPAMLVGYGPGFAEVFSAVTALGERAPDVAIFAANATASALVPVLAFALGRIAGLERDRALFAAGVLAIDPVAVRFSATESYFVPIVVLTLASSTAIAAAVRASLHSRVSAGALIVAAALFGMQAARIHPVAWVPVALCPLAVLFAGPMSPLRRVMWLLVSLAALAIALWLTSAGSLAGAGGDAARYAQNISHRFARPVVLVAIGIGFVLARARHGPLVLVAAVSLALDAILRPIYGQSLTWQACFDRLFVVVPVLAVSAFIDRAGLGGRMRVVVVVCLLAIATWLAWPLRAPTTEQVEYRWLRAELARLEPECRVASVTRAGHRVLYIPWYAMAPPADRAPAPWFGVHRPAGLVEAVRYGRCVVWLHASLCESAEGRPLCASIEDAVTLHELASIEIDAVPSNDAMPYDAPIVRIALSRAMPR